MFSNDTVSFLLKPEILVKNEACGVKVFELLETSGKPVYILELGMVLLSGV